MFGFFKKKKVKPFVPYIYITMDGHGKINMDYYPEWGKGVMSEDIPVPKDIVNHYQAEEYAKKFLEDKKKSRTIAWHVTVYEKP